ncbi:MAG: GNAT family N-acetyltransferase [Rubrobacter sp.]|nr:GNAT family N-acetyltransferase [Rubrobacter sp.]
MEEQSKDSRILALTDGTCVPVRGIQPEDAPALRGLHGRLSERTVYMRYFGPMKELSEPKSRHVADVNDREGYALVALDPREPEQIVAVAGYEREGETEKAEYAVLVEDRFQGRGLGLSLTRELVEAARHQGIERLYALVMYENADMLKLLKKLGIEESIKWEDGVEHVTLHLGREEAS